MFGFFKKKEKKYYIDFSEIGVDIHSHLIPSVDDGARDLANAIELVKGLKELGFKKIITTPHIMSEYYPNTSSRLLAGLDTLKQGLWSAGVEIEISCAAEYFMDEHFEYLIERNDILTLKNNYVLVEMSFFAPPLKLDEYLFKLQTKGYKPILAHPERYIYYSKNFDRFQDLKNRGCKMQLNLLSLLGHYGKEVKVLAEKLLENGLYDFAGTDTHNVGHIERLKTFLLDNSKNKIGTQFLNKKFLD